MLKTDVDTGCFSPGVSCGADFWLWYVMYSLQADSCRNAEAALTWSKLTCILTGVHLSTLVDTPSL